MSDVYESMMLISQALRSNLPLGEAIRLSIVDDSDDRNSRALLRFADLLDKGIEMKQAVRQSGLPSRLAIHLETAFESNDFAEYFAELAEAERARSETFRTISSLMAYPFFLLGVMFSVAVLVFVVIPKFQKIFWDFDTQLPALTLLTFRLADLFHSPIFWSYFVIFLIFLGLVQRIFLPAFWYHFPIIGRVFWTLASQKLLRQLVLSLHRHVPLEEALRTAAKSFRNATFRTDCRRAADFVETGTKFSTLVEMFPLLFPRWLSPFVRTAEQKDNLPSALREGIELLDEDRSGAAMLLGTVFMPVLCFLFYFFIGFFVLALFLPLIKLITELSG